MSHIQISDEVRDKILDKYPLDSGKSWEAAKFGYQFGAEEIQNLRESLKHYKEENRI